MSFATSQVIECVNDECKKRERAEREDLSAIAGRDHWQSRYGNELVLHEVGLGHEVELAQTTRLGETQSLPQSRVL